MAPKKLTTVQFLRKLARTKKTAGWFLNASGAIRSLQTAGVYLVDHCPLSFVAAQTGEPVPGLAVEEAGKVLGLRLNVAHTVARVADQPQNSLRRQHDRLLRQKLLKATGLKEAKELFY